jgi:outer membrane lipoprotein-sorting protein
MTLSRATRRRVAWSAPVLTAAVLGGAALLPTTASASAHPHLPVRTPAELLAAVQTADVSTLSGTIVETARLGLPSLPGAGDAAALSWQTLVAGTHSARVWLDGPDKQRLALLGQLSESDIIHNGRDAWTYTSSTRKVGHTVLPAEKPAAAEPKKQDLTTYTPQGAAAEALKAIDPSTVVTVDPTARVAGRAAYTLVLTPRDSRSTVRKVAIAIDATKNVPLRVQVFGAAATPAFETAFTDISYKTPAASVFAFTAPKGATVTNDLLGTTATPSRTMKPDHVIAGKKPEATTVGTGWTTVAVLPAGSNPLGSDRMLDKLTTTLPNGDKLLRTALLNALITKDGRVLVGAVSPAVLEQAAG